MTANQLLGSFATNFLKSVLNSSTESDLARRKVANSEILAVGCGRGYDMNWVAEAVKANLRTIWLDVSDVACARAIVDLVDQFDKIPNSTALWHLRPLVKKAEIRSALVDPETWNLEFEKVEIWYLCRVLGCLSKVSAKIVLRILGTCFSEDMDKEKKKRVVIVGALLDNNRGYRTCKSKLLSKRLILQELGMGAGRDVGILSEAETTYFGKKVSALEIGSI
jgi:hypothetical protein